MLFDKKEIQKQNKEKIEIISRRRRQVLVHSYLYYKMDTNLIEDFVFDKWCKELMQLQVQYPNESKVAVFSDVFGKWTGFSGYDLFKGNRQAEMWAMQKANQLIKNK